ncbi:class I SAM-dependent methyltransferase [Hoeflea poritis]|uniref:Class I SAM-dependent methyltransferase n=1 Tax=Hoeflea poritis TaxID=2993659 RepID=A0ABT4VRK3_9HYPH|nr:class I SAM-dependent methyltransferase [Hoeflea poritis]MDA4847319.1 class I SAM-dependent methyltransferase [Hoeflea poritis]
MTTPLAKKLRRLIEATGPISVADYFSACLGDPEFGYYRTREPFGAAGDFITAPEVSQLFGEMIGIFLVSAWQAHGRPDTVRLIEIGPGRGTLMADAQRVIQKLAPDFTETASAHLVETSERLTQIQRETLANAPIDCRWHSTLTDVPEGFTLLFCNELFDALPIRQFINTDAGFQERLVTVGDDGTLAFGVGTAAIEPDALPGPARPGDIFEIAPAREAVMAEIAARLRHCSGTALVVDYGHLKSGFGDTLQAVRRQAFADVLEAPGECDLTSHVDFEALAAAAASEGVKIWPAMTQGTFLLELGLLQRAGALGSGASAAMQEEIHNSVERLAGTGQGQMGSLFKVLCVSGSDIPLAPFARGTGASEGPS